MFNVCPMPLGARIRQLRLARGWKLEELSARSGVDVGTLSALEMRDSKRSNYTAAIAAAFGLDIAQLLAEGPAIAAREPAPPHHPPPGWLFTAELFQALQHRKPAELRHIEAIIRAHLQLPPLQADAGNRAAA